MAASAIPVRNSHDSNGNGATANGCTAPSNNSEAVGPTVAALQHNPGIGVNWTNEEQSIFEELLTKYASEPNIVRYAKIAQKLKDKTARDVALRIRWMHKKESGKRTKDDHNSDLHHKKENGKRRKDDHNSSRKNKDKKEKASDPMAKATSHTAQRSIGPSYAHSMMPPDLDDGISFEAIGGVTGQLLEQTSRSLEQISANFSAFKGHENLNLFRQARSNILSILNDTRDMPEIMRQMPPLPVKLQEDLANSVLGQL